VVWGRIGDFGDLTWIPNVTSFELDRDIRVFPLGASAVRHRLVRHDDAVRSYTYALVADGSIPVGQAAPTTEATISVVADGPSASIVRWTSEPDERRGSSEGLQALFQGILDYLKSDFEHATDPQPEAQAAHGYNRGDRLPDSPARPERRPKEPPTR